MFNRICMLISISFMTLAGCTCSPQKGDTAAPSTAAPANEPPKTVNLAIWSNYIPPALIIEFEQKHGVKVEISNYSSNEELLAKLQAGATGYDVAVPSDYMIAVMIKLGLLEPIDLTKIPNAAHIEERFKGLDFDPKNEYSLPYNWIITGIATNRTRYKDPIRSWGDIFNNPKANGKMSLLDDVRETLGAALKWQGYSLNSVSPDALFKAKKAVTKIRPHIKAFNSEPMDSIMSGDVAIAHMYSSDALQAARDSGGKVEFVVPKEGGTLAIDSLVIPKGARNVEAAHALINFLVSESANISMVQTILAGPVVKGIAAKLPKNLQENLALFPPPEMLEKCEMMQDLGDSTTLYDKILTEIKAGAE